MPQPKGWNGYKNPYEGDKTVKRFLKAARQMIENTPQDEPIRLVNIISKCEWSKSAHFNWIKEHEDLREAHDFVLTKLEERWVNCEQNFNWMNPAQKIFVEKSNFGAIEYVEERRLAIAEKNAGTNSEGFADMEYERGLPSTDEHSEN